MNTEAPPWITELGQQLSGEPDDPALSLLHEPLRPYVQTMTGGVVMCKHPWVNSLVPFTGEINRTYEWKFSKAREYLSKRDIERYLWVVVERPWRMSTLEKFYSRGHLSYEDARGLLPGIWLDTEFPGQNLWDPAFLWDELGFLTDAQDEWDALPDEFTIWRGGTHSGISWTLNKEVAEFFAGRFAPLNAPRIWSAQVAKTECQGFLTGRGEAEVIVTTVESREERYGDGGGDGDGGDGP